MLWVRNHVLLGVRKGCEADICVARGREEMYVGESEVKLENKYIKT